eukprot:TRINITY_DN2338_c0_g1_i1.p1 TRINITY_DN2338_c0_g1~~TRINITY_DN2338_c0_g1_i1.p1  ORF type:complete len:179 (-),score=28.56 TRINITY_DN2338_c0_g1_i1:38-574(-)
MLAHVRGVTRTAKIQQANQIVKRCYRPSLTLMDSTNNKNANNANLNDFGSPINLRYIRPVSPHFTIWKWDFVGYTSGASRATGTALVLALGALSAPIIISPAFALTLVGFIKSIPFLLPLAKWCIAFPLAYHTANGFRHMYWETSSNGLESMEQVEQSSKIVAGTSLLLSLIYAFIQF